MTESDKASWCGAVFDCHGIISMLHTRAKTPGAQRYRVELRLEITCLEKVEMLQIHLGVGRVNPHVRPDRLTAWCWNCGKKPEVIAVLRQLMPYLVERAYQAQLALEFLENENLAPARQDAIYHALLRRIARRSRRRAKVIELRKHGNGGIA